MKRYDLIEWLELNNYNLKEPIICHPLKRYLYRIGELKNDIQRITGGNDDRNERKKQGEKRRNC